MKAVVLILMILMSTFAQEDRLEVGPKDIALFIQGFLKVSMGEDFGDIEGCVTRSDDIVHSIEAIIKAVSGGKIEWMEVAKHIGTLIYDIPHVIQDCKELPSKIKDTLKAWRKKIESPTNIMKILAYATIWYQSRLIGDIKGFVDNWKNKQFKQSGESLGDIPFVLFNKCGSEENMPENVVLETLVSE